MEFPYPSFSNWFSDLGVPEDSSPEPHVSRLALLRISLISKYSPVELDNNEEFRNSKDTRNSMRNS